MIKHTLLLSFCFSLLTLNVQAQELNCGTTLEDNAAIKAQMLENRRTVSREEINLLRNKRSITYIPVTVHLINDANGKNGPDPQAAVNTICNLNMFYEHMDLQFYFHPTTPIKYLNNNTVFNDGYSNTSIGIMGTSKVANALNIFIGDRVSRSVAGYYSRPADMVFIKKSEANLRSTTLTHELGHFFTLPHTFYGWENVNYDSVYNGAAAPTRINNSPVEYKTRTGANANCQTAADGFCDTEADYYSFRVNCNHNTVVLDPNGERLTPNPSNYMSYFNDNCQSEFSNEQQDAIWASITNRRWLNFPEPFLAPLTNNFAQDLYPSANDTIAYTDNTTRRLPFTWTATPNAIGYIFELERMFMGQPVGIIDQAWVPATTANTVQYLSNVTISSSYRWHVRAVAPYACNAIPETFTFYANVTTETAPVTPTAIDNVEDLGKGISLSIMPNPIQKGQNINANIQSSHEGRALVKIFSLDGRLITQQNIDIFANEYNFIQFPSANLASGLYLLQVQSDLGIEQQKFIIE